MSTPRGTCPECGAVYYGWALLQPEHQHCNPCGVRLHIERPGQRGGGGGDAGREEKEDGTGA